MILADSRFHAFDCEKRGALHSFARSRATRCIMTIAASLVAFGAGGYAGPDRLTADLDSSHTASIAGAQTSSTDCRLVPPILAPCSSVPEKPDLSELQARTQARSCRTRGGADISSKEAELAPPLLPSAIQVATSAPPPLTSLRVILDEKQKCYRVRVASGVSEDVALRIQDQLLRDGYGPVLLAENNQAFSVVVGMFTTRPEAQALLWDMRQRTGYCAEAIDQDEKLGQAGSSDRDKVYRVQVIGPFSDLPMAEAAMKDLLASDYAGVEVIPEEGNYRVYIGTFSSRDDAFELAYRLHRDGYSTARVREVDLRTAADYAMRAMQVQRMFQQARDYLSNKPAPELTGSGPRFRIRVETTPYEKVARALQSQLRTEGFKPVDVVFGRDRNCIVLAGRYENEKTAMIAFDELERRGYQPEGVHGSYQIRVISGTYEKLARAVQQQLIQDGYGPVDLVDQNGKYTVLVGSYESESQAESAMEAMRKDQFPSEGIELDARNMTELGAAQRGR